MNDEQQTVPATPKVEPLLLGREQFAEALGISTATLDRLDSAGKLPKSVPLCRGRRRRAEVDGWLVAGCPARELWEVMTKASNGHPWLARAGAEQEGRRA